jgi:uncharacterized protein YjbJ (UPF0337 family)
MSGLTDKVSGKIKQAAGDLIDDPSLIVKVGARSARATSPC